MYQRKFSGDITFDEDKGIKYSTHIVEGDFLNFDPLVDSIDILCRHSRAVKAHFRKVANHTDFEVWKNVKYDN